jgi:hypothetical protein
MSHFGGHDKHTAQTTWILPLHAAVSVLLAC